MQLVTSAGETSQPQRLEAGVGLQVHEAHLDALVLSRDLRNAFVPILRRAISPLGSTSL